MPAWLCAGPVREVFCLGACALLGMADGAYFVRPGDALHFGLLICYVTMLTQAGPLQALKLVTGYLKIRSLCVSKSTRGLSHDCSGWRRSYIQMLLHRGSLLVSAIFSHELQ